MPLRFDLHVKSSSALLCDDYLEVELGADRRKDERKTDDDVKPDLMSIALTI